jgi:hypothetical protein
MGGSAVPPEIPARRTPAFEGDVPTKMRTQMCGIKGFRTKLRCNQLQQSTRGAAADRSQIPAAREPKKDAGEIAYPIFRKQSAGKVLRSDAQQLKQSPPWRQRHNRRNRPRSHHGRPGERTASAVGN